MGDDDVEDLDPKSEVMRPVTAKVLLLALSVVGFLCFAGVVVAWWTLGTLTGRELLDVSATVATVCFTGIIAVRELRRP